MKIGIVCDQPTMTECLRGAVTQAPEHQVDLDGRERAQAVDRCGADAPGSRADDRCAAQAWMSRTRRDES